MYAPPSPGGAYPRQRLRVNSCFRSPPLALLRDAGTAGLVERVELRHVIGGEAEVEDLCVLLDPLAVSRLRDHRHVALDRPAQQDLRRRALDPLGDRHDLWLGQVAA